MAVWIAGVAEQNSNGLCAMSLRAHYSLTDQHVIIIS